MQRRQQVQIKGPEAGICLILVKDSKEARVTRGRVGREEMQEIKPILSNIQVRDSMKD